MIILIIIKSICFNGQYLKRHIVNDKDANISCDPGFLMVVYFITFMTLNCFDFVSADYKLKDNGVYFCY